MARSPSYRPRTRPPSCRASWARAGRAKPPAIHRFRALLPGFVGPRAWTRRLRPRGHADREWRWRSHQPLEPGFEERLGAVQVDGPADAEHAIAEEAVGRRVPVS